MALFRDYDQAALDAQYDLRAASPNYQDFIERWAADSAKAREDLTCRLDVAYGKGEGESLDVFPAAAEGAPILLFLHGGNWQSLDKSDFSALACPFVEAGVTVVIANYRLAPAAGMDEIARQAQAAVGWVLKNAAQLGGDARAVYLCGHSAGAHLAALALTSHGVAGAALVSGLYDLEPLRLTRHNEALKLDEEQARRNSPVHLKPAHALPLLLAVGEQESGELQRQTADLAQVWGATRAVVLPGRDHCATAEAIGDRDSALFGLILDLIDGRL